MSKNFIISILAVLLVSPFVFEGHANALRKPKPLGDGFTLSGIDGKLISADGSEDSKDQCVSLGIPRRWFFEFDSDIRDGKGFVKAGAAMELLPSTVLEKITADANGSSDGLYRLWGTVTRYKYKNFIFPNYFLPLSEIKPSQLPTSQESQQQEIRPTINEPNDELPMPQGIIEKIKTRKIIRTEQLKKGLELKQDSILADRTGFIVKQNDGQLIFTLDAVGWNVPKISFRLLPCEALERACRKQSDELERVRFNAAGIVTKYKGSYYLLLQRATRVYSYGNFGR